MITQYSDSYSSLSSEIQNIIANKVALLDQYILMQTGQYEYTALIYNPNTKKCTEYTITRSSSSGYSNYYTISESTAKFEYTVLNEYYVFSNIGYGRSLSLPVHEGVQSFSLVIICCLLCLSIVFERVFYRWRKGKR